MKPEIERQYVAAGHVVFVWRDFAWIGDESRLAAQGARCGGEQGRFWEYHDHLYDNQRGENRGQFAAPNLKAFATAVGLDRAAFDACLERAADVPGIQEELRAARGSGITSTPSLRLNGRPVPASTFAQLQPLLDAELARLGR